MHPLEREIIAVCQQHRLFGVGERVVVGVSGGPDSMALLAVLHAIAPRLRLELVVAHVNHGLRPSESEREEELVQERAKALALPCEVGRVDVRARAAAERLSLEEAARELRYAFFHSVTGRYAAGRIAVAHTADDQAEEVLLRLIRGTGRKGLAGMAMSRAQLIVRPFLQVTKQAVLAYLREKRLAYLIDSSNADRAFLRNRVRLELLPFMAARLNPKIRQVLRQTAAILHEEDLFLDAAAEQAYQELVAVETTAVSGLPVASLRPAAFSRLARAMQRRVLEKTLIRMGIKAGFRQIEAVAALALSDGGGSVHLAKGLRAVKEGAALTFSFPAGMVSKRGNLGAEPEGDFALLIESPGEYELPGARLMITMELLDQAPSPELRNKSQADYLDFAKLSFPLELRKRRAGDRFHPLGAPGAKKVADFLSDLKVPRSKRGLVPVLLSAGKIIALPGYRIADHVRLTEQTSKVLRLSLSPLRKG